MSEDAPAPILFNVWKHHFEGARARLGLLAAGDREAWEALASIEGVVDVYVGLLPPVAIGCSVIGSLADEEALTREGFVALLVREGFAGRRGRYLELPLPDGSRVTLRLGRERERFVHVHPSRHAPLTIRVRAATWKTALACVAAGVTLDVETVDAARARLGLPPVPRVPDAVAALVERLARRS